MLVEIDRTANAPLYLQIHQQLREMILIGSLPEQTRLPPTRDLAKALDVNRTTVVNAYRRLWGEGLIEGRSGGGTIVAPYHPVKPAALEGRPLAWDNLYTECVSAAKSGLASERALPEEGENLVTFALGVASGDVTARHGVLEALAEPLLHEKGILERPVPQGSPRLRKLIVEYLELDGIRATPSQVLVLSGAEQGIFIVGQALLGRGDGVAVASPTFPGALRAFSTIGARVHSIPMDSEGIRLDVADGILRHLHPKLLFVEPTFHNPTGITMSLERRQGLLELAYRYQTPILELDARSMLRYDGLRVPSLKTLDRQNHVLYLSTFSEIVPGLRVGWLVGPQRVSQQLHAVKNSIESYTSGLGQSLACALFPWLDEHLTEIVAAYRARRDAMCDGLAENCKSLLRWTRPDGGLFIWGELQHDLLAKPVLEEALRTGVSYVPGSHFFADGRGGKQSLRLNFAGETEERITEGVERLGRALRAAKEAKKEARSPARKEKSRVLVDRPRLTQELPTTTLAWEVNRRLPP